jgi:hypothetical protein
MLELQSVPRPKGLRLIRRHAVHPTVINLSVPLVRASALNPRLTGDVWVCDEGDGTLTVCLDDRDMAHIRALPVDLPSFNHLLERARSRRPRRR